MNFELVVGRAKSGKSTYMRNISIDKMKAGENIAYIVPEHMTYATEMELIKQSGKCGFLQLNISSFKKLQEEILSEVGGSRNESINDYGKIMLLKQICDANKNELKFYGNSIKKEGFLKEVNAFIKDIKKSRQEINLFDEAILHIDNSRLVEKIEDIVFIYNKIDEKFKDKYSDSEDKTNTFIENIKNSDIIKNTHFVFDGFESLIGQRLSIIKELIKYSKSVTFSLCLDREIIDESQYHRDFDIFEITYNTYKEFEKICEELNMKISITNMNGNYINKDEFKFLENQFHDSNSYVYERKCENLYILPADNIYEEIKNISINILELVRKEDYRYKDIAVVTGSVENYAMTVKNVFNQFNIPVFIDEKKKIVTNPLIKYILLMLEMLIYNFKQQTVLDFMKTGYYDIKYNELDRLENFVLEYGIEGYRWFKPFETKHKDNDFCENIRIKFAKDFDNIRNRFNKLDNAKDITLFIYEILEKHKLVDIINSKIDQFRASGHIELAYLNSQVWNNAMDICEQIIMTSDDSKISTSEYKNILESGFKEIKLSIIPPSIDKITFGDLDRATLIKYKAVFIVGANESVLIPSSNDAGLLMDRELNSLREYGIKLVNSSDYNDSKHKHMLYRVMCSPIEKLIFSYSYVNIDEKMIEKSQYIDRLLNKFTKLEEKIHYNEIDKISNESGTFEYLIENINNYINNKPMEDIWKTVYHWYLENNEDRIKLIKSGVDYKNNEDILDEELSKKLYSERLDISVSKLEKFAKCNFQYFIEFGLKAMKRKELKVEFYNIGNVFHNSVQLFVDSIIDETISIKNASEEEIIHGMLSCVDKILEIDSEDKRVLEYNNRNAFVKTKIKRLLSRVALIIAKQLNNSDFKPYKTEFDVQKSIKTEIAEQISFKGRIDRIDCYEQDDKIYFNIIDYKSSGKKLDINDAIDGLQLQLLAYMSVLINDMDINPNMSKEIGGVFYFNIDDPFIETDSNNKDEIKDQIFSEFKLNGYAVEDTNIVEKIDNSLHDKQSSDIIPVRLKKDGNFYATSNVLAADKYSELLNIVENNIKNLSEDIIKGEISINPCKQDDVTPCTYCEYRSICQFDPLIEGNSYRTLNKRSKEEISELLEKK